MVDKVWRVLSHFCEAFHELLDDPDICFIIWEAYKNLMWIHIET